MARVSASDQLTRLLALPAWVAENPGVTVKEAAEHFGVPPAVIERDVNTLWVSGLPGGMHGDLVDFDASDFEAGRCGCPNHWDWTARFASPGRRRSLCSWRSGCSPTSWPTTKPPHP